MKAKTFSDERKMSKNCCSKVTAKERSPDREII